MGAVAGAEAEADEQGEEEEEQCVVCLAQPTAVMFVSCGHLISCAPCSELIMKQGKPCPYCRKPIERAVAVFKA